MGEKICELASKTAAELLELVRSGQVSPVDVVSDAISAAEAIGPTLNCFITVCGEQAYAQALAAEKLGEDIDSDTLGRYFAEAGDSEEEQALSLGWPLLWELTRLFGATPAPGDRHLVADPLSKRRGGGPRLRARGRLAEPEHR